MDLTKKRVVLPGFGLPIDTLPVWDIDLGPRMDATNKNIDERPDERPDKRFPHLLADFSASEDVTLRERRMLRFVNTISDLPQWDIRVFDDRFTSEWRAAHCRYDKTSREDDLSEAMFNYCILELRDKARIHQEKDLVRVLDTGAAVVKSDFSIPESLRAALTESALPLETVPAHLKDWHPDSNGTVLNLLNPSLFPLIYGRSKALAYGEVSLDDCAEFSGMGEAVPEWDEAQLIHSVVNGDTERYLKPWSLYQWLPARIEFTSELQPRITSYINNLHPKEHKFLYKVLEQFVDKALPVWNESLSRSYPDRVRIKVNDFGLDDWLLPAVWPRRAGDLDPRLGGDGRGNEVGNEEWARQHDLEDEWQLWVEENCRLRPTEPRDFKSLHEMSHQDGARCVDLKSEFTTSGLQVIFQLRAIHLSPEKPKYDGNQWHVEGALNEHICATAFYYYDSDNISSSTIAFRQAMEAEDRETRFAHNPKEYSGFAAFYGIENEGPGIQELGSVCTRQGRLLAIPNTLQHRAEPFHLVDPARPGHQKILAMYLVDPHIPVLSTANVPPQRKDWWADEIRKVSPFRSLPQEIFLQIMDMVDWFPLSGEEACAVRDELVRERNLIADGLDEMMNENKFCLGGYLDW